MTRPAPLFVSHGAPSLLTGASEARAALKSLGESVRQPKAYVVISAHWESSPIRVTASPHPETIHDFRGFGDYLARFEYSAVGDPALARQIVERLRAAKLQAEIDLERGLDHGVWVPMALLKPVPDAPVLQVSLPARASDDGSSFALGLALETLVDQGVQLIFSGAPTHSLRDAIGAAEAAPVQDFAVEFNDWIAARLQAGQTLDGWHAAPHAARNHPTPEHLRPLLAAAELGSAERLHHSWTHGALAMDFWRFAAA